MYIYMYIYIYIYIPVHVCFKEFWQKILRENLVEILVYKIWIVSCICRVWIPRFLYILQKAKILQSPPPKQFMDIYGRSKKKTLNCWFYWSNWYFYAPCKMWQKWYMHVLFLYMYCHCILCPVQPLKTLILLYLFKNGTKFMYMYFCSE